MSKEYNKYRTYIRDEINGSKAERAFKKYYPIYNESDYFIDIMNNRNINQDIIEDFSNFTKHYIQNKRDIHQYLCFMEFMESPRWYLVSASYYYEHISFLKFDWKGFVTIYDLLCDDFSHFISPTEFV